ncbi:MBL fold metallo-hydrolase [Paenibacillus sp. MB22_1]|uniref:MBL fold metallo-hydrolase n=1 Tax=Paenibacillus TaxID=44249 RepID=UPI0001AFD4BB|nr:MULTISPECIES: MBL fold metallo-hydrolase [unclassified Paenibacillus]EES71255.1 metallo-beta-lactamase domain protein [Paenibacillus sp. oral taxon 786 str. D14]MCT2197500.1 MBL fold metallo-hydrolase [Paenibacillus sp. p3-SID1389]
MRITEYGKLIQLSFLPRFFPVNCYLVEEEDGVTLIDAALPYSAKGILKAVEEIGKPLTRIVLTHVHDDHVGALDALKAQLPEVPVYVSARDARLMEGDVSLDPGEPTSPIRGGVPKKLVTRADVTFTDGERIGSLLAVAAPGHTPGSFALLDTRSGALIAGDAFQTRAGIAVSGTVRPLFPFPALATWHKETALASARKLAGLNPSLLAVGHGPVLKQPAAAIAKAIAAAERALGKAPAANAAAVTHRKEDSHVAENGN